MRGGDCEDAVVPVVEFLDLAREREPFSIIEREVGMEAGEKSRICAGGEGA